MTYIIRKPTILLSSENYGEKLWPALKITSNWTLKSSAFEMVNQFQVMLGPFLMKPVWEEKSMPRDLYVLIAQQFMINWGIIFGQTLCLQMTIRKLAILAMISEMLWVLMAQQCGNLKIFLPATQILREINFASKLQFLRLNNLQVWFHVDKI